MTTKNEATQRDELLNDILASALANLADYTDAPREIADTILSEGYRKPRTITTVEELDALPEGSVVLDRNGLSLHKMGPLGIWNASNHTWDVQRDELEADAFPATVLHEPEAEVGA